MKCLILCIVLFVTVEIYAFDAQTETLFELYTRASDDSVRINLRDAKELSFTQENPVHFDANRPTRIFVHGYFGDSTTWEQYAKAYLDIGDYNFIGVNWTAGAKTLDYPLAAMHRVKAVGRVVAEFIDHLVGMGMSLNDLILVGHSLGAHICGIAGKNIQSGKLLYIIGLDPAKPLFHLKSHLEARLHFMDAQYVQVIHTSGGFFGIKHPIGHIDFYPNYGCSQPGCNGLTSSVCSHTRVHDLFTESLRNSTKFIGMGCGSVSQIFDQKCIDTGERAVMGGDKENMEKATGLYYLETFDKIPFPKNNID